MKNTETTNYLHTIDLDAVSSVADEKNKNKHALNQIPKEAFKIKIKHQTRLKNVRFTDNQRTDFDKSYQLGEIFQKSNYENPDISDEQSEKNLGALQLWDNFKKQFYVQNKAQYSNQESNIFKLRQQDILRMESTSNISHNFNQNLMSHEKNNQNPQIPVINISEPSEKQKRLVITQQNLRNMCSKYFQNSPPKQNQHKISTDKNEQIREEQLDNYVMEEQSEKSPELLISHNSQSKVRDSPHNIPYSKRIMIAHKIANQIKQKPDQEKQIIQNISLLNKYQFEDVAQWYESLKIVEKIKSIMKTFRKQKKQQFSELPMKKKISLASSQVIKEMEEIKILEQLKISKNYLRNYGSIPDKKMKKLCYFIMHQYIEIFKQEMKNRNKNYLWEQILHHLGFIPQEINSLRSINNTHSLVNKRHQKQFTCKKQRKKYKIQQYKQQNEIKSSKIYFAEKQEEQNQEYIQISSQSVQFFQHNDSINESEKNLKTQNLLLEDQRARIQFYTKIAERLDKQIQKLMLNYLETIYTQNHQRFCINANQLCTIHRQFGSFTSPDKLPGITNQQCLNNIGSITAENLTDNTQKILESEQERKNYYRRVAAKIDKIIVEKFPYELKKIYQVQCEESCLQRNQLLKIHDKFGKFSYQFTSKFSQ